MKLDDLKLGYMQARSARQGRNCNENGRGLVRKSYFREIFLRQSEYGIKNWTQSRAVCARCQRTNLTAVVEKSANNYRVAG